MAESGIYNRFKANLMNKEVDLEVDDIKVILLDDTHTFAAGNTDYSDISANELDPGSGYSTGGETLTTKAVTEAATTKWTADDVEWSSASFTAYNAVIYDIDVTNDLIATIGFGGAQTVTSGTFKIQWDDAGIITLAE